ncbi:hypothetical protein F441_10310 [Phytophthora nicotianae CJ01A1]|nr:hypothetical protein L915_10134 [Phytophthora nicotianae]ETL38370.1 hypothetical protein L916_10041 [Phytophthora nicotianae]ETP14777.1 hypothetical protein F441_10310 [Phytophthora nicotianae CJ01A1]KUF77789.1 hypothetical protein AM587_10003569 [Phytophthora nicotianae]KUF84357.1 Alkaline phosphatase [Phytophthora nicotianae]
MKVLVVITALATLLMPTHGALRQCAGTDNDYAYERSGSMTADFTQKACAASGGSIDPSRKGNQKCCNVPDARQGEFNSYCFEQKAGNPNYRPTAQSC